METDNQYATDVEIQQPGQEYAAPMPIENTPAPVNTAEATGADVEAPLAEAQVEESGRKVEISANTKPAEAFTWETIDEQTRNSFVEKATNGKIKDLGNLAQILKENEELKSRPTEPQFGNEKQKSLYEFLSKYSGEDYTAGLQHYMRIDALDPKSLDSKSAIKEQYIIDNLKIGIPAHLSEQNFEDEFQEKFNEDDNRTPFKLQREGELAKRFLLSEKDSIKATLSVKNEVDTAQQEQEEKQFQAARLDYESRVKQSLHGDKGAFEAIDFSFGDTPDEKFSFKIPDVKPIEEGMMDYQEAFFNPRYAMKDANGRISGYDTDKMRNDLAILNHYPEMLQQTADHFKKVGTLEAIKQRVNITTPEQRQSVVSNNGADSRYASDVVIHKR